MLIKKKIYLLYILFSLTSFKAIYSKQGTFDNEDSYQRRALELKLSSLIKQVENPDSLLLTSRCYSDEGSYKIASTSALTGVLTIPRKQLGLQFDPSVPQEFIDFYRQSYVQENDDGSITFIPIGSGYVKVNISASNVNALPKLMLSDGESFVGGELIQPANKAYSPTNIQSEMLSMIPLLSEIHNSLGIREVNITEAVSGKHSDNSPHYTGNAFDLNPIDGKDNKRLADAIAESLTDSGECGYQVIHHIGAGSSGNGHVHFAFNPQPSVCVHKQKMN